MKILHTADWHLGHRLHEQSQFQEQLFFLQWITKYIDEQKIDLLLISGDIFDTGVPSTQSQKLYYDFLVGLQNTHCSQIIITGGNHDAPGTINAPKGLLEALSIHVIGKATNPITDEVIVLQIGSENIIIAAVPYLRDRDIRSAISGETFDEINQRYKTALVNHYTAIAEHCKSIQTQGEPIIAMGHLFAIGGSTSDSEQQIYVGNLGHIGSDDFPSTFDYIALGHLHRPQIIGNKEYIRYSGSPNILSFSEVGYDKKVIVLETLQNKINTIKEVTVPTFRSLYRIKGDIATCTNQLHQIANQHHELTPWIEITLVNEKNGTIGYEAIHKIAEKLPLQILKVILKEQRTIKGLEQLISQSTSIKELSPMEVFKNKCAEQEIDLDEAPEILDAFYQALQIAKAQ